MNFKGYAAFFIYTLFDGTSSAFSCILRARSLTWGFASTLFLFSGGRLINVLCASPKLHPFKHASASTIHAHLNSSSNFLSSRIFALTFRLQIICARSVSLYAIKLRNKSNSSLLLISAKARISGIRLTSTLSLSCTLSCSLDCAHPFEANRLRVLSVHDQIFVAPSSSAIS